VNRAGRTGGTFLHTSRTRPSHLPRPRAGAPARPLHGRSTTSRRRCSPTSSSWGRHADPDRRRRHAELRQRLHEEGVNVVAIPKTMDNDVPGTDYCIGFSTCVTRTIELTHRLRTSAGSHERFLVIEVFGRYAGFTALLPTMAGAADRCVIPEHPFDIEQAHRADGRTTATAPEPVLGGAGVRGRAMAWARTCLRGRGSRPVRPSKLGGIGDKRGRGAEGALAALQQRQRASTW
jgi:ATP-dependent phosphofructokinase / diphosphate-dependent phosphofructokinase